MLRRNVRIFYDTTWLRSDGEAIVALGPRFHCRRSVIAGWKRNASEVTDLAASWWFLFYQPQPGDVIVDIGAGMGEDTLLFSRSVGARGMVYSFEAHPLTFRCLKKTVEYSKLANVATVYGAVFNKCGAIEIDDRPELQWQENSVMASEHQDRTSTLSIPAFALDDFEPLQQQPRVHFLKMNIEGAEVEALRGMSQLLTKVNCICVACHDFLAGTNPRMRTKDTCCQILTEAGFAVHPAGANSPPWQRDHIHGIKR